MEYVPNSVELQDPSILGGLAAQEFVVGDTSVTDTPDVLGRKQLMPEGTSGLAIESFTRGEDDSTV